MSHLVQTHMFESSGYEGSSKDHRMRPTSIRGAVSTHVAEDINLNTSAGLSKGFLNIARECLADARELDDRSPRFTPALDDADIPDEVLQPLDKTGKYIL